MWPRGGKFEAFTSGQEATSIGLYDTPVEAAVAYAKHIDKSGMTPYEAAIQERRSHGSRTLPKDSSGRFTKSSRQNDADDNDDEEEEDEEEEKEPLVTPCVDGLVTHAEGFKLHLSKQSSTGYQGVYSSGREGRFIAMTTHTSNNKSLGSYGSAIEAAVAYARQECQRLATAY